MNINKKYINILSAIFMIIGAFSCKKDKYQNYSQLNYNNNAFVAPFAVIRKECEGALDIPFKFKDGGQIVDMNFEVSIVGGTATEGEDYDLLTSGFDLLSFKDSVAISLDIYEDEELEDDETIIIRVREIGSGSNFPTDSVDITVTIINTGTSELELEFNWEKELIIGEDTFNTCDIYDIDILLFDEEGNDLGIYAGATTSCPESYVLDIGGGGPITFYFTANLWGNYIRSEFPDDQSPIPITTTINRIAGGSSSFTQSNVNSFKVSSLDSENDEFDNFQDIAKVVFDGSCSLFIYNTDNNNAYELRKKKRVLNNPIRNHRVQ
jgi:hypothetical protein